MASTFIISHGMQELRRVREAALASCSKTYPSNEHLQTAIEQLLARVSTVYSS